MKFSQTVEKGLECSFPKQAKMKCIGQSFKMKDLHLPVETLGLDEIQQKALLHCCFSPWPVTVLVIQQAQGITPRGDVGFGCVFLDVLSGSYWV